MIDMSNKRIDEGSDSDSESDSVTDNDLMETYESIIVDALLFPENSEKESVESSYKKSMDYEYRAMYSLDEEINSSMLDSKFTVHICAYQVNVQGLLPFLQFFMHKLDTDTIQFPQFEYKDDGTDFMTKCIVALDLVFFAFKKMEQPYIFQGFKIKPGDRSNLYLFFDCSVCAIESHKLDRINDVWLCIPDELINHKSVCNFPVANSVLELLEAFPEFLLLHDSLGEPIESPTIAYIGGQDKQVEFYSVFGSPKLLENGYTKFTSYKNAICEKKEVSGRIGIVRFAIFLGSCRYKPEDGEPVVIGDAYDSLYQNIGGESYWFIKRYEQQTVLTHHYINRSTGDEYIY